MARYPATARPIRGGARDVIVLGPPRRPSHDFAVAEMRREENTGVAGPHREAPLKMSRRPEGARLAGRQIPTLFPRKTR